MKDERLGANSDRKRGLLMAFGGMLAISADSPLIRIAEADAWAVSFWYGVLTAPTMLLYLLATERGRPLRAVRRNGWIGLGSAALQAASTIFFALAVKATAVANVVAIVAVTPLVAALLAWLLLRERTSARTLAGAVCALGGIVLVVGGSLSTGGLQGVLLAFGAVASFSLNLVLWRQHPELSRTLIIALSGVFAALIALPQATLFGHSTTTYAAVAAMGIIFGPIGRVLLASSTRLLSAAEVGLVTPVETVAATIWAWWLFAETPPLPTALGAAVILAGVLYGTTPQRRSQTRVR